jgi:hypothetical protein
MRDKCIDHVILFGIFVFCLKDRKQFLIFIRAVIKYDYVELIDITHCGIMVQQSPGLSGNFLIRGE